MDTHVHHRYEAGAWRDLVRRVQGGRRRGLGASAREHENSRDASDEVQDRREAGLVPMSRRMLTALIALVGLFIAAYLALYKMGYIGVLACGTGSCAVV